MSLSDNHTIIFFDDDAGQDAVVIIRVASQKIGLSVSLEHDGDIEVFLPISKCELVVDALQRALSEARGQPTDTEPPALSG
jgi:hypothetical protein